MASSYKLRCSLFGHEQDVRALCNTYFPDGAFVSGSRDVTARLWVPDETGLGFSNNHIMRGHRNFVVSVCTMPPDEKYPHGLIMTGSNDNIIHAYSLETAEPQYCLQGHTDTVCALAAGKFGSLLSGSWDKTAKVWLNQKCVMTLTGHEAAVWAVVIMPEGGYMLTGSADKTIRMWRAGKCERTFKGHDDCVRGLAVVSASEFLSCGNDTVVRRWLTSGECTHTYHGHSNYVYSVAILPNGEDFVTGGEDRTLRVWRRGECVQTIEHPTESVWAVCALPNSDVATAGSDGVVRVFSAAPERQAEASVQTEFEDQLVAAAISKDGHASMSDLPGPEILLKPGVMHNQVVRVKDTDNKVSAHKWNSPEQRWEKQDVIGGSAMPKKTEFEGKEYDYVFTVEIQEGAPPLKLPFNVGDDPWLAAHTFLERNELSQQFLDQVAKFITDQTGVGGGEPTLNAGFADPFTGGGRYIPSSGAAPATAPSFGADPFTGGGSYKPAGAQSNDQVVTPSSYFPQRTYIFFEQANAQAIVGKLREFNGKVGADHQVAQADIAQLEALLGSSSATAPQFELLWKLLQWPTDVLFPALDVFRLCVREAAANQHFFGTRDGGATVFHLLHVVGAAPIAPNHMLVVRALCNALSHAAGEAAVLASRDAIVSTVMDHFMAANKNVQIAFCTLLLNLAVAALRDQDIEAKSQLLSAAATVLPKLKDTEATFRLLVCIGTLAAADENSVALARSLDIPEAVGKLIGLSEPAKLPDCAKCLLAALQ